MKKLMYLGFMFLSLHVSLQCSLPDSKNAGKENTRAFGIGFVIAKLDFSRLPVGVFTEKVDVNQQTLPETLSTSAVAVTVLDKPLSMSRGFSFHSKADVSRLQQSEPK